MAHCSIRVRHSTRPTPCHKLSTSTYTVQGNWGETIITDTVELVDAVLQSGATAGTCSGTGCTFIRNYRVTPEFRDVDAVPTVLFVSGTIEDGSGTPLDTPEVTNVIGDGFYSYYLGQDSSGSTGAYSLYLIIDGDVEAGTLLYSVSSGGETYAYEHDFADITPYTRNDLTHNLTDPFMGTPEQFTISTVLSSISAADVTMSSDNKLYIAGNNTILEFDLATSTLRTVTTGLSSLTGVAVDPTNTKVFAGGWTNTVRQAIIATGAVSTVPGIGTLALPTRVAVDYERNLLYISVIDNHKVIKYNLATGTATDYGSALGRRISTVAVGPDGSVYFMTMDNPTIYKGPPGDQVSTPLTPSSGLTVIAGNGVLCTSVTAVCGDGGPATNASFGLTNNLSHFYDLAIGLDGSIYIADEKLNRIRRIHPVTGIITTIAGIGTAGSSGDGGLATSARLNNPQGIWITNNNELYIADTGNNRIRKLTPVP
ncbi:MAG: hypothetical protein HC893_10865 [Chloroflexaceae bacterium]|nr:hypothetical protein [Chloroflexaceae bacterium]